MCGGGEELGEGTSTASTAGVARSVSPSKVSRLSELLLLEPQPSGDCSCLTGTFGLGGVATLPWLACRFRADLIGRSAEAHGAAAGIASDRCAMPNPRRFRSRAQHLDYPVASKPNPAANCRYPRPLPRATGLYRPPRHADTVPTTSLAAPTNAKSSSATAGSNQRRRRQHWRLSRAAGDCTARGAHDRRVDGRKGARVKRLAQLQRGARGGRWRLGHQRVAGMRSVERQPHIAVRRKGASVVVGHVDPEVAPSQPGAVGAVASAADAWQGARERRRGEATLRHGWARERRKRGRTRNAPNTSARLLAPLDPLARRHRVQAEN